MSVKHAHRSVLGRRRELEVITTHDSQLTVECQRVAENAQPIWDDLGRRSQVRIPYSRLIQLHPVTDDGIAYSGQPSIYVVGKNLAKLGLDFFHHEPLALRYAVVSLPTGTECFTHFVVKITWCRFLKQGWYDSGGRFVKAVKYTPENLISDPNFVPLHRPDVN